MSKEEYNLFLKNNKRNVDIAIEEFEKHSAQFNKKIKKVLSVL